MSLRLGRQALFEIQARKVPVREADSYALGLETLRVEVGRHFLRSRLEKCLSDRKILKSLRLAGTF